MPASGHERFTGQSESRRNERVDLYELLEISPCASQDVIQAAYRALARKYHPDVNAAADAATRIRELNDAYGVLSDPSHRAQYDLECSRARRYERLNQPDLGGAVARVSGPGTFRRLPAQPRVLIGDRVPVLNGRAVLGVLLVGVLAAFLIAVLWVTLDPASDSSSIDPGPRVELSRR